MRVGTEVLTLLELLPQLPDTDTTCTPDPLPAGTQPPTSMKVETRFWYKGLPDQADLLHSWCPGPHGPVGVAACLLPLDSSRGQMHLIRSLPAPSTEPQGQAHQGILRMLWVLSVLTTSSQNILRIPWCACCSSTPTSRAPTFSLLPLTTERGA